MFLWSPREARMRASRRESCGGIITEGLVNFKATKSDGVADEASRELGYAAGGDL